MTIPLLKPSCSELEISAVVEVLKSGWWGQGPRCEQFELELAELYGYKHAITVNSATAALHLALLAYHVGPGDEVILPAMTFVSTGLAVLYTGATPVFVDVDPKTLTIDWNEVERKTTSKTKAIIPVDYAGYPADGFYNELPIIQDAAHSAGGLGYGNIVCLSFHPVKSLATGDGGAILTDSDEQAERLKSLRWCGINKSTYDRVKTRYGWDYDIEEVGYKYHWNDIQAAIGLSQLARLPALLGKRQAIAYRYTRNLRCSSGHDDCGIELPPSHGQHTWHLYPVRVEAHRRNRIIDFMLERGISVGVHYKPLTLYPMFQHVTLPVTDFEWQRLISLPIYFDLSINEVDFISETLQEALKNA